MSKQVEVLIKGKQQTEGTLHSLKRQVDALDELVSNTSTDSLFPSLNSSGLTASFSEDLNLPKNQVCFSSLLRGGGCLYTAESVVGSFACNFFLLQYKTDSHYSDQLSVLLKHILPSI